MSTNPGRSIAASTTPPLATVPASTQFEARLATSLAACAEGTPAALLHLDIACAIDIEQSCGASGFSALHERVYGALPSRRRGARGDPMLASELCGFTLLLRECSADDALHVGERLRAAVESSMFEWNGHPFRLGVHVGVVELGGPPRSIRRWLEIAREASVAARELGGTGVQLVELGGDAWSNVARECEWHDHLREIIA